jgi:hypothetical protein
MDLALPESGKVFAGAKVEDILDHIDREPCAILSADPLTYVQCGAARWLSAAVVGKWEPPDSYILEYQDGSVAEHYRATEGLSAERVQAVFVRYLLGEHSWRSEFQWEKLYTEVPEPTPSDGKTSPSSNANAWSKVGIAVVIGGLFVVSAVINAINRAITSHAPLPDAILDIVGTLFLWTIGCLLFWAIVTGGWWRLLLPIGLIAVYLSLLFAWPLYTLLGSILIVLLDIRRRR